jgi:predicted S18 family serine protease
MNTAKHLFTGLLILLMAACAAAPVQEMSDARQALQAAREVGAERLAGTQYQEALQLMTNAERELDGGDFYRARDLALTARQKAVDARQIALDKAK